MSALTLVPSPRLRAVSADSAQEAVRDEASVGPSPHLRLVTDDADGFEVAVPRARAVVELPAELSRRPAAPRAARAGRAGGSGRPSRVVEARPADLAPNHPAVRAQRRRELERRRRAAAAHLVAHGGTHGDAHGGAHGDARGPAGGRTRETARSLPVGLRRLMAVSGLALVAALVISIGIVISGSADASPRTTTVTVRAGQSLWEIAAATGVGDVDRTMARIVELNDLESSALEPGRVLVIPAG